MTDSSADRNLLFGILALQNNFISHPVLLSALKTWTRDKSQPLGRLLVAGNQLKASQYELLEALVAEHLAQHNDSAQQSLAAVAPSAELTHQLTALPDADLQHSLSHFSGNDDTNRFLP